jgi:hypothetical protein
MRQATDLVVQQMLEQHGRPLALYHVRHGIFQQNSAATEADSLEEQLAGTQDPTQFGCLGEELEITSIAVRSPQAKGRVERFFGTLQERTIEYFRAADSLLISLRNPWREPPSIARFPLLLPVQGAARTSSAS